METRIILFAALAAALLLFGCIGGGPQATPTPAPTPTAGVQPTLQPTPAFAGSEGAELEIVNALNESADGLDEVLQEFGR